VVIIVLVLLVIIVIALVGVIAFLLGRGTTEKSDETAASTERTRQVVESVKMVLDEESAQNVMQQMREEVEEGMFECQMSMKWNFPDGQSTSKDAYVANSTNNRFPFYFDVRLDDTDELVYSSAVMPVGTELKNIKLDKELPAGTYKAIVYYTLVRDTETQEAISTAGFGITITVQN
jgi:uncharacterized protein (UPF0333 family)